MQRVNPGRHSQSPIDAGESYPRFRRPRGRSNSGFLHMSALEHGKSMLSIAVDLLLK